MDFEMAVRSDLSALCELLSILFAQEVEFQPNKEAQEKGLLALIDAPENGHVLIAREEGKIIGMVCVLYTISTALGARVAFLEDMIVAPEGRGKNVGSELLAYALDFAKGQGCQRITLLTDQDNTGAHRFYEKQGFTRSTMVPFRLSF